MSTENEDKIEDVGDLSPLAPKMENGEDKTDWKAEATRLEAEATKFRGIAARNKTRAEKAKAAAEKPAPTNDGKPKPGEFDYGQKAFLVANGIKGDEEMKLIKDAVVSTGKTLEDIIQSPYVQGELKGIREAIAAKVATPPGENGRPAPLGTDSVDYWIKKGELPPKDQTELRTKVVNARLKQEKAAGTFSSTAVVQ